MSELKKYIPHFGNIPSKWERKYLSELGEIVTGSTPKTTVKENWIGDLPFVSPTDINEGKLVYTTERKVSGQVISKNKILPKDSVMYTCIASIGKIALSGKSCTTNQQINSIIPTVDYSPHYIYYALLYKTNYIKTLAGVTAVPIINKSLFSKIELPIPPLKEQQKIASILSSVDEAIEKTEQIIEQTEQVKKGIMQQLLTKGIGHTEFKDTSIGRVPENWNVLKIGDICNVKSSKRIYRKEYLSSGVPFYRSKEINELNLGKETSVELFISRERYEEIKFKYGVPEKGDLLITTVGTIGNTWISDGREFYYKDGNLTQIKKNNNVDEFFLAYLFESNILKSQYLGQSSGSAQVALTIGKINRLRIPLPRIEEQKKIVNVIETFEDKLKMEKDKLKKIEFLKQGLMQQLLTGKVRVPINESEEVTT